MTSDRELRQLLTSGIGPGVAEEKIAVKVMVDGREQTIPVSVDTFFMMHAFTSALNQLSFRLDGIHAHLSAKDHPKSKGHQTCVICATQDLTPEQLEELRISAEKAQEIQQDAEVVAGNVGVSAGVQSLDEVQE